MPLHGLTLILQVMRRRIIAFTSRSTPFWLKSGARKKALKRSSAPGSALTPQLKKKQVSSASVKAFEKPLFAVR